MYSFLDNCSTCAWFFERSDSSLTWSLSDRVATALNDGIERLDDSVLELVGQVAPNGIYDVVLLDLPVRLIAGKSNRYDYFRLEQAEVWPHEIALSGGWDPQTSYYRSLPDIDVEGWTGNHTRDVFHVILPIYEPLELQPHVVESFGRQLRAGGHPTTLAVTTRNLHDDHEIFAHILLDGHHKTYAAALSDVRVRLLALHLTSTVVDSARFRRRERGSF